MFGTSASTLKPSSLHTKGLLTELFDIADSEAEDIEESIKEERQQGHGTPGEGKEGPGRKETQGPRTGVRGRGPGRSVREPGLGGRGQTEQRG